jgi:uncharacterized protein with HEPN domain
MIEDFTSGMDFESFRRDPKTVAAGGTVQDDLPPLKSAVTKALIQH